MIEMTLELAEKVAKAAHEKSMEYKRPMSVSIVDEAGRLVYYSRADNAGFFTFDTSRAKAMASASFKRSTMEITEHKVFTAERGACTGIAQPGWIAIKKRRALDRSNRYWRGLAGRGS